MLNKTEWGRRFQSLLNPCQADCFAGEQVEAQLAKLEETCPTPLAWQLLGVALVEVGTGQLDRGTLSRVTRATLAIEAENNIEGAVSWVAKKNVDVQVNLLRSQMMSDLPKCNFIAPPMPKKRQPRLSVSEALDMPLNLNA